jgi:ribonuclease-3
MNNIRNKLITKQQIESIINTYMPENEHISINNIKKFQKAFIHRSFCNVVDSDNSDSDNYCAIDYNPNFISSNERLEFLGDKVIDLITTEFLFDKYPDKDEGFLTKLKSRLVKKESLAYLGEKLGFKELLLLSSHIERISGRNNPRFLEDIFESFMGTFYKDQHSNLNVCKKFLLEVYNKFIDINDLINNNDNYKDSLLRYYHSKGWGNPEYKHIYYTGTLPVREFTCIVLITKENLSDKVKIVESKRNEILQIINNDQKYEEYNDLITSDLVILGIGKGGKRKIAEQECSKNCLNNLKISLNF